MFDSLSRRTLLQGSAAVVGASVASGFSCVEIASAAKIEVPTVDKLTMRVLIDSSHDQFLKPITLAGIAHQPPGAGRGADYRKVLHNQWGLSLFLESQRASEQRTIMLDFGYSPDALINNIEILKPDPGKINALIVSHGHFDHFGGLQGFLEKYRNVLPADVKLYAGGEDNFCRRHTGTPGQLAEWGTLDRRELATKNIRVVLCETPTVIEGHAFTTGKIARRTAERVLPNTHVEFAIKDGLGCDASHYTAAELQGKIVPDEHIHEHATCFNIKDKGLVVVSSCGHVGIVNSARQAMEVSGVQKVHALVGGFHLGPASADYLKQVIAEIKTLDPDVVIPMHCSGDNFMRGVREMLPDKLLLSTTGSRFTFGA